MADFLPQKYMPSSPSCQGIPATLVDEFPDCLHHGNVVNVPLNGGKMNIRLLWALFRSSFLLTLLAAFSALASGDRIPGSKQLTPDARSGILNKEAIMANAASLAVPFVKNVGQFDSQVKYAADLFSGRFFLTANELVYALVKPAEQNSGRQDKRRSKTGPDEKMRGKGIAFKEFFVDKKGVKIDFKSTGEEQATTKVSYFKGNNPNQWRSGVASYQGISLGEVFPGVEVKLKASGRNVEKIFFVSPQTDVAQIKIGVTGVDGLEVAADGRLLLKNSLGELAMRAPIAWQEIKGQRHEIKVRYHLIGKGVYGFAIQGDYDKNLIFIIDPGLEVFLASTFLGGTGGDSGYSLVLDHASNVYITGYTSSADFPTTFGAFNRTNNQSDVFISKLDPNLTTLLASTFLCGSGIETGSSIALDNAGNVVVSGGTTSADFPTTPGAYDRTGNSINLSDAFITKLDSKLTTLLASTYLGGSREDSGYSLVLDKSGNVYLTGRTSSDDFPTTIAAYDRTYSGSDIYGHAFVSKLNGNLTTLLASTYLGGSGQYGDQGYSLALDSAGNVYMTGETTSANFPITPGAYRQALNGYSDIFVSKMDGNLGYLMASTFLGGSEWERGRSLALDSAENVFLTGYTSSDDFPTTPGAYDRIYNGYRPDARSRDVFVSRLDCDLTNLLASTFLPGCRYSGWGEAQDGNYLTLDGSDNVYVTGLSGIECFYESIDSMAFVSKLDRDLTTLLGQKCLGGGCNGESSGTFLALDQAGDIYLTGYTGSLNFPTTPGAYDQTANAIDEYFSDAFISKLNGGGIAITVASPNGSEKWRESSNHEVTWVSMESITNFNIDYSIDSGQNWIQVAANIASNDTYPLTSAFSEAKINSNNTHEDSGHLLPKTTGSTNTHSYVWTIPPSPSTTCLVRISDAADASINDTSDAVFSILMNLDLQIERREVKSFSITKEYGMIQFMITHPEVLVAECRILRSKGTEGFILLKFVLPSELQNNQFQMQDKYLDKNIQYTYLVEAYNAAGQLVGRSAEKTI